MMFSNTNQHQMSGVTLEICTGVSLPRFEIKVIAVTVNTITVRKFKLPN